MISPHFITEGIVMSSREREAWQAIKFRCNNPNYKQWKDYGGRGIRVQFSSFEEFLTEVGSRPPGMTIERIDNDGHYERGNVRWATRKDQQRNRRNTLFVEIKGKKYRALDLAEKANVKSDTIVERVNRGLSLAEVMSPEKSCNKSGLALGGAASGAKRSQKTHCSRGHEFTFENTRITPEGWRNCRTCHCLKMRKRNKLKKREA